LTANPRASFLRLTLSLIKYIESDGPAVAIPTDAEFYSKKDPKKPDLEFLKNHFLREGRLSIEQALFILKSGTAILKSEETLLDLESPLTGKQMPKLYICIK
jgi:hypothetical protein